MAEITSAGESGWVLYPSLALSVLAGLATLLARRKLVRLVFVEQARLFAFIFVCIGLTSLVSTLAKVAIGRGRPVDIDAPGPFVFAPDLGDWADQSFPSGHATTAFALATVLSMLSLRWRWPAFGAAALVGLSRVVLGMHYPSDVLGGAALGIVGACAIRNGFAQRKLVFEGQPNGRIALRPFSALRRYLSLKRRGGARVSL
ncbi:MAG: phosphatase PAP2 family protein [Devosia sp.]